MRFAPTVSVVLLLIGAIGHIPVALVMGLIGVMLELGQLVWRSRGIQAVDYVRHLERNRVGWGEEVPLTIEVWNRTGLPLSWLEADDESAHGVTVAGRPPVAAERADNVITNVWSLAPSERVFRPVRLTTDRRGVYALGPVRLTGGDLFARPTTVDERGRVDRFLVRPRVVAAPTLARPDRWGDLDRARSGLSEDPSRFAGIRPWVPGDSLRRIHPRASARLGRPMSKRFEPSRERNVLIALDVQTSSWTWEGAAEPDEVEALYVVAASLATSLERDKAAFGIIAAGYALARRRLAEVAVSGAPGQAGRVLDLLARLQTVPSAPYERVLETVRRTVSPNTVVVALTARDPSRFFGRLRALERAGSRVVVLASGADADAHAGAARSAGFVARTARLDGPWRAARELVVA